MAEHALNCEQSAAETVRGSAAPTRATPAPREPARVRGGWKQHIARQLKHRDQRQHALFQGLISIYTNLMEKTTLTKRFSICAVRPLEADCSSDSLRCESDQLKKTTGELAYKVLELQKQLKTHDCFLEKQQASLVEVQQDVVVVEVSRQELRAQVEQLEERNQVLKREYDALLERRQGAEHSFMKEDARGSQLLVDIIYVKKQAAAHMNTCNERKSRAREAKLQKELQTATRSMVSIDSPLSAPSSRATSPTKKSQEVAAEKGHTRLFRSVSATSPRILSTIRELFERKRRGHSTSSLEEELYFPPRICICARVPARALQVLDAHEEGINAVKFRSNSDLLATGGTDRVVKLWEVRAGTLNYKGTLDGPTEGITSVEFDPMGMRVLAASYDKSAILWRLDDSIPKLTLTGHRRKVTAARFSRDPHHVVTGSLDRTVRLWDLQRAACVQVVDVSSCCSDLVCSESCIISGHYDSKIRIWDTRSVRSMEGWSSPGKVTSLDISSDHRQLLSCCRDDCLQLMDLRWSNDTLCFRAEGFKCGSDSTKAVFSPDGSFLAAGSADGAVYIWKVSSGNLETRLPDGHSASVSAVSWSVSGDYVVSVDKRRRAVLWSDF
ncbi:ATG16 autophagy related 16-like 2 [Genypterus blacodes]|uniref:ATG16 autophagy related 16-like 2 n=1 Tax=Genypterus blacodes TaxID=154954 RepID=UPI003F75EA81